MINALIILSIFKTVEFYVIVLVFGAIIVGIAALPDRKGEVKVMRVSGDLKTSGASDRPQPAGPGYGSISLEVHEGNIVSLRRCGLQGVSTGGFAWLTVSVSGFDIVIEEHIGDMDGRLSTEEADEAVFIIDFLSPEWYHIRYESERYNEHAALTLHVKPGIMMTKPLIH